MSAGARPIDWSGLRLVAFDVDGTLYRQRPLRLRMARAMLGHALRTRNSETFRVLGAYRRLRERIGDARTPDFERVLEAETARAARVTPERVRALVAEWMVERPLPHLLRCRYDGLDTLFDGLRRHGKIIGILSDYPAEAKLAALGLAADLIVSAGKVGMLKPHPLGLETLMRRAGAKPDETLLIGDRPERDGVAAREAGARALIRTSKPAAGWDCFARFDDPVFAPVLAG